jgi:hypothetical protein
MIDSDIAGLLSRLGLDADTIGVVMSIATLLTVLAVITAIPTGRIAERKGRSRLLWVLFALSVPLIPLLLVALLPAVPAKWAGPK